MGRQHERDDLALFARASGAAGAVQVRLVLGRRVDVNHEFDVVNVHATGGYVRRDENAGRSIRKRGQVAVTLRLRKVAMKVDGRNAGIRQLLGQLLRVMLRTHEQDAAALARGQLFHQ